MPPLSHPKPLASPLNPIDSLKPTSSWATRVVMSAWWLEPRAWCSSGRHGWKSLRVNYTRARGDERLGTTMARWWGSSGKLLWLNNGAHLMVALLVSGLWLQGRLTRLSSVRNSDPDPWTIPGPPQFETGSTRPLRRLGRVWIYLLPRPTSTHLYYNILFYIIIYFKIILLYL